MQFDSDYSGGGWRFGGVSFLQVSECGGVFSLRNGGEGGVGWMDGWM